jgi:hypothetical protein
MSQTRRAVASPGPGAVHPLQRAAGHGASNELTRTRYDVVYFLFCCLVRINLQPTLRAETYDGAKNISAL